MKEEKREREREKVRKKIIVFIWLIANRKTVDEHTQLDEAIG